MISCSIVWDRQLKNHHLDGHLKCKSECAAKYFRAGLADDEVHSEMLWWMLMLLLSGGLGFVCIWGTVSTQSCQSSWESAIWKCNKKSVPQQKWQLAEVSREIAHHLTNVVPTTSYCHWG